MAEHALNKAVELTTELTAEQLITENLDIWTSAIEQKSASGRGSSKKFSLHGIKKLRELILELAVRGKLVPQDPTDEPASVLLARIAAEKAQLVKDKKIKKPKALPEISEDEKPFVLPHGWEWSRVGTAFNSIMSGGTPSKRESSYWGGDIPWASVKDLGKSRNISSTQDFITEVGLDNGSKLANIGDLLICTRMGLGKIAIVDKPLAFNQDLKAVTLSPQINIEFFLNYYSTIKIEGTGTTVAGITQEQLLNYVLALPPLEEQHRIVAKVDELMSLCDALEAQTEASLIAHQTLVETLLGALLLPSADANSPEPSFDNSPEQHFRESWQRIAEHFDTLFTTSASIDTLKQTILQLAVMGKLVPQDTNDEPAAKLLERIAAEKAQLIADKKIKKQKPLPTISNEEKPFELPNGWEWVRFEDLVDIQGGITKGRKLNGRELITVKYLSVANVQRSYLDLGYLKEVEIPIEEKEKYQVKARDLLITEGGDWDKVGRTAIWSDELPYIAHQNHVFKARIFLEEQSEAWLEKYLNGPYARDYFAGSSKQTTNLASINKTQLRGCLIAIPPKEEKDRIIAKVDELMALCDQLKARLSDAQTTQLHLTDAIVEQAI